MKYLTPCGNLVHEDDAIKQLREETKHLHQLKKTVISESVKQEIIVIISKNYRTIKFLQS